jgi:hypothetical protein
MAFLFINRFFPGESEPDGNGTLVSMINIPAYVEWLTDRGTPYADYTTSSF